MGYYIFDNRRFEEERFAYSEFSTSDFAVGNAEKCPVCGGFVSMLELVPPIEIILSNGFLADFIFGEITPFIVSQKFKEVYLKDEIKGVKEFLPVSVKRIRGQKEKVNVKYFIPLIHRSDARIDEENSHLNRSGSVKCFECKKGTIIQSIDGLRLIPGTWSGEDIFYAKWLASTVFVNDKFVNFVRTNGFTNGSFTKASEYKSRF